MAISTIDTSSISALGYGFKNRIINGAMVIDQRNAGASFTPSSLYSSYTLDRWVAAYSVGSKFSVQQSSTAPAGFINSAVITSLSAYTVGSGENYNFGQIIEGLNMADLGWGTANAQTVTISFWVRSSLTGTFGGAIQNSASNRSYPFSYTISSANTWEQKSITVAGDTSGTWLTTNGVGARVYWGLGCGASASGTASAWAGATYYSATGATSVVGTNGATWYVTGVQLEKGVAATAFDYRPYGTELALCQRYYESDNAPVWVNGIYATGSYTNSGSGHYSFKTPKRASASVSITYVGNIDNSTSASIGSDNYLSGFTFNVGINSLSYPYARASITYKASCEL